MTRLDKLTHALPRPTDLSERPEEDWTSVIEELGFQPPEDYREFLSLYGTGCIDEFLWVLNPFSENTNLNLIEEGSRLIDAERQFIAGDEEQPSQPYGLDMLYPWGVTDNGDVLYWLMSSPDPDEWTVLVCNSRSWEWEEFPMGATRFLSSVLTKEIRPKAFPNDFPSNSPAFQSH